jgi:hypothetical protein
VAGGALPGRRGRRGTRDAAAVTVTAGQPGGDIVPSWETCVIRVTAQVLAFMEGVEVTATPNTGDDFAGFVRGIPVVVRE